MWSGVRSARTVIANLLEFESRSGPQGEIVRRRAGQEARGRARRGGTRASASGGRAWERRGQGAANGEAPRVRDRGPAPTRARRGRTGGRRREARPEEPRRARYGQDPKK